MSAHFTMDMGFAPLIRQRAYSQSELLNLIKHIIFPTPSEATLHGDSDSDTESDAGWYPDERDVEKGLN